MIELQTTLPLEAYLAPSQFVDSESAAIRTFVDANLRDCDRTEAARRAFTFVRDDVAHSYDIDGVRVTRTASDAMHFREGICYPKSHLLAALLRRAGIPAALCYQRLTLLDDDTRGYAVHALNAVHLDGRWHRLDARGNKPGVNAEFSLGEERLAFPIRAAYEEVDYPTLFAQPHPAIIATLVAHDNARTMYFEGLPTTLD